MSDQQDDIFADDYVPARKRSGRSIDQILEDISSNKNNKKLDRWKEFTPDDTEEKPENKVKRIVRKHLENKWNAIVIRTNAGRIKTKNDTTIFLGEKGQSDLHVNIPMTIDDFTFGIFMAVETKAPGKKATEDQKRYIQRVKDRGGIAIVVGSFADVDPRKELDEAIIEKMLEIQGRFIKR